MGNSGLFSSVMSAICGLMRVVHMKNTNALCGPFVAQQKHLGNFGRRQYEKNSVRLYI